MLLWAAYCIWNAFFNVGQVLQTYSFSIFLVWILHRFAFWLGLWHKLAILLLKIESLFYFVITLNNRGWLWHDLGSLLYSVIVMQAFRWHSDTIILLSQFIVINTNTINWAISRRKKVGLGIAGSILLRIHICDTLILLKNDWLFYCAASWHLIFYLSLDLLLPTSSLRFTNFMHCWYVFGRARMIHFVGLWLATNPNEIFLFRIITFEF